METINIRNNTNNIDKCQLKSGFKIVCLIIGKLNSYLMCILPYVGVSMKNAASIYIKYSCEKYLYTFQKKILKGTSSYS